MVGSAPYAGPIEVRPPVRVPNLCFRRVGRFPGSRRLSISVIQACSSILRGCSCSPRQRATTAWVPGADIRYTTDGSEPDFASRPFGTELRLDATVVLKARAFLSRSPPPPRRVGQLSEAEPFPPDGIPDERPVPAISGAGFMSDPQAAVGEDPDGDGSGEPAGVHLLQRIPAQNATSGFAVAYGRSPRSGFIPWRAWRIASCDGASWELIGRGRGSIDGVWVGRCDTWTPRLRHPTRIYAVGKIDSRSSRPNGGAREREEEHRTG